MTTDRELGMSAHISRRDFLQAGAAVAGLAPTLSSATAESGDYPPARTGMRGSHEGSYEDAHALGLDGQRNWGDPQDVDELYDLVVVGAGVSGLAAAYFYRQAKPDARILVLDNHDDFGGHAKRNEFTVGGRSMIGYGGSQSLEAPSEYSSVAKGLLRDLSVDLEQFYEDFDQGFYRRNGLTGGIFFDEATYGRDHFALTSDLLGRGFLDMAESLPTLVESIPDMPLSERGRADLLDLVSHSEDSIPDVGLTEVTDYLWSLTYEQFLSGDVGVSQEVIELLRKLPCGYFGYGTDQITAMEALGFGMPGINKLGVPGAEPLLGLLAGGSEPYIFHFPDGNAGVTRAMVRSLIPELSSVSDPRELVQVRFDYRLLDRPENNVRIRLSSTAVDVRDAGREVQITYRKGGRTLRARGKVSVLACYNMMIPHLCPQLPAEQKAALSELVKMPLVYTNVVLGNWRAVKKQHMALAYTPNSFHNSISVDFPVSMAGYHYAQTPDEPMILHLSGAPIQPGLALKDQFRAGRARLLTVSFEEIERDIRRTLTGILAPGGFDPGKDIAAITVNRWPHGYAYDYNTFYDPEFEPGQAPHEIGRRTFGNIAIANSDAGARAYLDEAIDQAHRAVSDLV